MALRLGALHDALLNPGNPDLALKAAEEVAGDESRLATIDTKLAVLTGMVSIVIALGFLILGKVW